VLLTSEKMLLDDDSRPSGVNPIRGGGRACPRCESQSIAHSRIRGVVGQFARRMLGVRPYRCLDCWHRFLGVSRH